MTVLIIIMIAITALLFVAGITIFLIDTHEHMKYLNEREAYWIEVKRKREEKEKSK